jgi:hypothetical protein
VDSPSPSLVCEVCGARVVTLRRGRCWICYVRWAESRPVGIGAACAVCGERRRDHLRSVEFQGSWTAMCHNCGTRAVSLTPMPPTIEALRQRLNRDRRWSERRLDRKDHRLMPIERRVGERRALVVDPRAEWYDAEDLIVEIVEVFDADEPEPTRISNPYLLENRTQPE